MSDPMPREDWTERRDERSQSRRDSEEMLDRVSRSEAETASVYRRIEDQLRTMGRRLDSAERSQSESNRVMSKAAVEMNVAAREQAQAFDQLGHSVSGIAERLDRVERQSQNDGMRDAVKALHQGLARLADQIAETANQSATQISALAGNIEAVAGRVGQARHEAQTANEELEARLSQLDERVRVVEKAAGANTAALERTLATLEDRHAAAKQDTAAAIAQIEESVGRLEMRGSDPQLDRRLSGIERTLGDLVGRMDHEEPHAPDPELQKLAKRLEAAEAAHMALKKSLSEKTVTPELPPQPPAQTLAAASPFAAPPPFPDAGGFELPPFVDPQAAFAGAPPFAEPAFAGAGFDPAGAFGGDHMFSAGQGYGADALKPPTVDNYLSAARRSARAAAAQAETESANGVFGGLGWSKPAAPAKAAAKPRSTTMTIMIGVLALVAIAVVAAAVLNHRDHQAAVLPTPAASVPAKPAANQAAQASLKPQTEPVETAPAASEPIKPAAKTAPSEPTAVPSSPPAQKQAAAKPAPLSPLDRLTQEAEAGNATAETVVGLRYLEGDGVPESDALAAKWLGKAAEAGQPVAQYRLGTLYERGKGVAADPAKSAQWYQAAANQGNRKAMHNLAVAYAQGVGVKKDFIEAARWFSKAANLGLSDSQFNLAVLYERGLGVPQSLMDAYKWYAIAAAQGDAESRQRIDAITTQLSADDRAAAQHAADSFKPAPLDAKANVAPTLTEVVGR